MLLQPFYYRPSGSTISNNRVIYPANMDKLMIPLCNAINKIPGLQTAWCCQGHPPNFTTRNPYVSIYADSIKSLNLLSRIVYEYNLFKDPNTTNAWVINYSAYTPEQFSTSRVRVHLDLSTNNLTAKIRTASIRSLTQTLNSWIHTLEPNHLN